MISIRNSMQIEQGSIILVPFPFTDLSGHKTRPALVLSNKHFSGEDVIVCAITTQLAFEHSLVLSDQDLADGRLPLTSHVRYGKLATLERSLIQKVVARVASKKMRLILKRLDALIKAVDP